MNLVLLVGVVSDKPFRPGGGPRSVCKVRVHDDKTGRVDQIEFDGFREVADQVMNLWIGDLVGIHARLEDRRYQQGSDEVAETRCVAEAIEVHVRARDLRKMSLKHLDLKK